MPSMRPELRSLLAAVDSHVGLDRRESADAARVRRLIEHGEPWSRESPLHVTASALVVNPSSRGVLLRWHERIGRWMQVGGHGDPGEHDPWQVALREAREETGLGDLRPYPDARSRAPVQIVVVPVAAHGSEPAHEHADIRYLLATDRPNAAVPEVDTAPIRWLPIAHALAEVEEPNLRELMERAYRMLASR
jgi:8-oxo-dGTP pyrophosphatase MutT (NUDIX family)